MPTHDPRRALSAFAPRSPSAVRRRRRADDRRRDVRRRRRRHARRRMERGRRRARRTIRRRWRYRRRSIHRRWCNRWRTIRRRRGIWRRPIRRRRGIRSGSIRGRGDVRRRSVRGRRAVPIRVITLNSIIVERVRLVRQVPPTGAVTEPPRVTDEVCVTPIVRVPRVVLDAVRRARVREAEGRIAARIGRRVPDARRAVAASETERRNSSRRDRERADGVHELSSMLRERAIREPPTSMDAARGTARRRALHAEPGTSPADRAKRAACHARRST